MRVYEGMINCSFNERLLNGLNTQIETIAIYARISTGKQESLNQLDELRSFVNRQGWQIFDEYIDQQSGGTSDRDEFKRLFADAHKQKFDLVLFWALDRFSREGVLATLKHLELLNDYSVGYKSYTEQYIDSIGIFREAIIAILAALAKQERVRISERTIAGLVRAKAQGKRLGMAPLADSKKDEIRQLRLDNMSYRQIANATGVSVGSVSNVLNSQKTNKTV